MKVNLTKHDYEFILNNSTDGIIVCDLNGDFLFFNKIGEKLLGLGDERVTSDSWVDTYGIFHPITKEPFLSDELPLIKAINGKTVNGCEIFIKNKNNKKGIYINVNASPLLDHKGEITGGISVFHDITEKVIKRQALIDSNEHLKDFASSVAHDINSPISAAIGLVNMLEMMIKKKLSDKELSIFRRADKNLRSVSKLALDLLDYSKVSQKKIEIINLNTIVEEIITDLEDLITEKEILIKFNDLPKINSSQIVFRKVLQNIIENSMKFKREDTKHYIKISCEDGNSGNKLILIEDNGMGFNNEDAQVIFSPLTRVHKAQDISGSGLGLSICKKLLEENDCKIWGTSDEEFGATFFISMPKNLII